MGVRQFYWRDLPKLLRYRHQGLFFDSALVLTRGAALVPLGALSSYIAPATGIFTYLCTNEKEPNCPLIGQVTHGNNMPFARLIFLTPETALESDVLPVLIEQSLRDIGERGAQHLLAEVDEESIAFEALRKVSFAIYARQRAWYLKADPMTQQRESRWREAVSKDIISVRSLYNNLVPGMVQQIEPLPKDQLEGLVCRQEGELVGYAEVKRGSRGIWVQPFINPDVDTDDLTAYFVELLEALNARRSQAVYFCVRSYQSWLENHVEGIGAVASPQQAVMVKHLAVSKKVEPSFALQTLEGRQPEVTASITSRSVSNNS
jgi:hypothetical protein